MDNKISKNISKIYSSISAKTKKINFLPKIKLKTKNKFTLAPKKKNVKIGIDEMSYPSIDAYIDAKVKFDYVRQGDYSDLLADEAKYSKFVKKLGYEYYSSYSDLSEKYQDTSYSLNEDKIEICSTKYIITLEDKITKNKVLGIRDIVSVNLDIISKFYFTKIVILGDDVVSSVFGQDREIVFLSSADSQNDNEIDKYFEKMMGQAILLGASDIHIQKTTRNASLWFRIDGIKVSMGTLPVFLAKTLKRRLVTMADQEDSDYESINGIINYSYGKKKIKFRLGLINSKMNFSLVMRLIGGKGVISHDLRGLNYPSETVTILDNLTKYSNGMVLVTGQVGSGKTHLMYALLKKLASQQQYVVTIEDPVEYVDEAFFQIDLSEFASASEEFKYGYQEAVVDILRQDSNIILIGETREKETAAQLVNASNLGQLVFSTMHTNSAPATVSRMTSSLGINEGDVVDNLRGIVSQKLVRKLCSFCKIEDNEGGYKKVGCGECSDSGFKDRVPIAEVIRFKIGAGGDFNNPAEYVTTDKAATSQYEAGFITKEDSLAIIKGEEVWYD